MARKRMIDPEFWSDEKVGNLSFGARLLFIGMWNFADDEGIIKARPEYLKSVIFPYDNFNELPEFLKELSKQKLIFSYEVDDQHFILILNFLKHQIINKPVPSKYPKPAVELLKDYRSSAVLLPPNRREDKRKEVKRNKEKIKENNSSLQIKGEATSLENKTYGDENINKLIDLIKSRFEHLPRIAENRRYASILIKSKGLDRTLKAMEFALNLQDTPYSPKITSYKDLWNKWNDLEVFAKKSMNATKSVDAAKVLESEAGNAS